jgi:competence protein ComEC
MFFWTPYAFVRFVLFLIAGILLGIYQVDFASEPVVIAMLVLAGLAYAWIRWKRAKGVDPGWLVLLMITMGGYLHTHYNTGSRDPMHFMYAASMEQYRAVIHTYPEEKNKSWKSEAIVSQIYDGQQWREANGKVLLYFSKSTFSKPFQYGDDLLIRGAPQALTPPANPGEFDYKRFLSFKQIYHQQYLQNQSVHYITHTPASTMMAYSFRARALAEEVLRAHIQGDHERAVASALVLGIKDGLDNELVNAYASSGAMHVLAVSGLHVGILYMIVLFLLRPLQRKKYGQIVLAIASIGILWCYAFLTGLSPSVLRAVTMFSCIAVARALNYSTNIFNTLAVTAFVLLMFEPYMIMSVGFQLSFLAVIGIVYLQPRLYQLWIPRNLIVDKIWQISCVSFAAQLATGALGILYFHQFPVYFLVSNLFVIPGALISLCVGLLLLATGGIPAAAAVVGNVFEDLLFLLNYLVFRVEQWPFSLVNDIYITTFQSWMIIGMIVFAILLLQFRRFAFLLALAGCGLVFGMLHWYHYHEVMHHARFVVYKVNGNTAMEWLADGQSYFAGSQSLLEDADRMRFHIRPNRLIHGVQRVHSSTELFHHESRGLRLYVWQTLRIGQIIDRDFSLDPDLELDYLVISNNSVFRLEKLAKTKVKHIIIDSSNSYFTADRLLRQAHEQEIPVYSVLHQGAFSINL